MCLVKAKISQKMFNIPENKLPDPLRDESRLNVLFAPIRNKSVNSKDWDDKILTWKSLIKVYCETNDVYAITLSTLSDIFVRHGRPPSCLKEVIEDMIRNKEVEVIEVYLRKNAETWSGWATDLLIKRPLSWSYNTLKNTVFSTPTNGQYVYLEVVRNKSETLLVSIPDNFRNKLISLKELLQILNKDTLNKDNVKLLLHYLANQRKIGVKTLSSHNNANSDLDTILIKFGDGHKDTDISELDIGIYTLERNEQLISRNVESIEDEIESYVKEAKNHLAKNHRQMAKSCLVKKHKLEKQLEKKANALHNVQSLLEQLKGTHSDAHVWEAYKNALNAFNTTYKETGLSEDAVEDTMLKLGEVLDIHKDIQAALARPATDDDTASDLEQELEELMRTDTSDQNQPPNDDSGVSDDLDEQLKNLTIGLPDVPESSPDVSLKECV